VKKDIKYPFIFIYPYFRIFSQKSAPLYLRSMSNRWGKKHINNYISFRKINASM